MPHARVRLHGQQFGHRDRSRTADPRHVVAHQVDDHDVLGGVLGRGPKTGRGRSVRPARGRALDRRRDHLTTPHPQEELRAEAGDRSEAGFGQRSGGQGRVRRLQLRRRLSEDHRSRTARLGVQPNTEVQLVEIAPVDPADHLLDCGQVAVPSQPGRLPGAERPRHQRLGPVGGRGRGRPARRSSTPAPRRWRPPARPGRATRTTSPQPVASAAARRRTPGSTSPGRSRGRPANPRRPGRLGPGGSASVGCSSSPANPASADPGVRTTSGRTMINTPPPNQLPQSTPGWSATREPGDHRLRASVEVNGTRYGRARP